MDSTKALVLILIFVVVMRFESPFVEASPAVDDALNEIANELELSMARRNFAGCQNIQSDAFCDRFKEYCNRDRNAAFMQLKCSKSCGFC